MPKKIPKIVKEIQQNPPHEIDYSYQKNISYSQISMFKQCQRKWALHYKDKINQRDASIYLVFGIAIHEVIQDYLTIFYSKSKVKANELDLELLFQKKFIEAYEKQYKQNNKIHFSNAVEMREFFEDGVGILNWFKKKRAKYFSRRGWHLVGCELPLVISPNKMYNNIKYTGFLDVVLYDEKYDTFKIIDIKTSTKGWNARDKKNEDKQYQLLLYKQFFSEQYGIPLKNIDVEFFIVKRKVLSFDDENIMSPHQAYRVQTFSPPSGKIKLSRAKRAITSFINECFNSNGDIKDIEYPKSVSKWNCMFCPFKEDKETCGEGIIF